MRQSWSRIYPLDGTADLAGAATGSCYKSRQYNTYSGVGNDATYLKSCLCLAVNGNTGPCSN